jgi:hypothetical protein
MLQFVMARFIPAIRVFAAIHIQEEEKKRKREETSMPGDKPGHDNSILTAV